MDIRVERDAESAARACAEILASATGDIALTGGTTPGRAYELAASRRAEWNGVTFWWGDERCVPPEHEWSNYGLAKRALLDRVRGHAEKRIEGELGADDAAARYDEALRDVTLDVVLLGLGSDGHAASLFARAPGLDERERRAIAAAPKLEPFVPRVTMTIPVLEAAPVVVWLVAGPEKADAVRRAFAEPPSREVPASLIRSRDGETIAFLDREAAQLL